MDGSPSDLADLALQVSVPRKAVNEAADALERGINKAADHLEDMARLRPNVTPTIARLLEMSDATQTRRMACAILANALVFHERIAGMHQGIKPLAHVCGQKVPNPHEATLSAWFDILNINYWPIFAIAKDILTQLPSDTVVPVLQGLRDTAMQVAAVGGDNAQDLTGRAFQRLIADRKYLASFYTLPESAALLARMAVAKLDGMDWGDAASIGKLRIGDFACGTGALLFAAYEQIANRHERLGGDTAALHKPMMEDVLYGCDVIPSAIHLTGSTLADARPNVGYGKSQLYTLAYGRQHDGSVKIGSLELLRSPAAMTLMNTSDPARRTGSIGEETAAQIIVGIPDKGFDLVIMNPPFSRSTNHEGAHANVINPAFAAFDATGADMDEMGARIKRLGKGTCFHGNAGVASAFVALADKKLKPGGVLALVLPLSASKGTSWNKFRDLLSEKYTDLEVVSIGADGEDANGKDMCFSSDTGIAECLVVARKLKNSRRVQQGRATFTSLRQRPQNLPQASAIAQRLCAITGVRDIANGPYGGTSIKVGVEPIGQALQVPHGTWNAVRVSDITVSQVAHALTNSQLWSPREAQPLPLSVTTLSSIGRRGLVHRDIDGPTPRKGSVPRGPFDKLPPSPTSTYPCLWNHDAKKETRMICEPDSQLEVRVGQEKKSDEVWATASRSHLNLDFRFNSQPLSAAFTERASIGGTAWPNVIFDDSRFDYAFTVWGNSTLGLLLFWWHSNRQQHGRGRISIKSAESLPILDFRKLSEKQLTTAKTIFDDFRELELKAAYLADVDRTRDLLDWAVICDLLGFEESVYLAVRDIARKWCAEPSVHGGKKRPPEVDPVI